jgi:predicted DNA-binding transcriptional regulator AlpA
MRFLSHEQLGTLKGIPGTKVTIWRQEKAKKFPKRTPLSPQRYAWVERVIDTYLAALVAGHAPEEATAIAERDRERIAEAVRA